MNRASLAERIRKYDAWYQGGGGQAATASHRLVMQVAPSFKDHGVATILDVGCGRGKLLDELMAHGFMVTGTEICPSLLTGDLKKKDVLPYSVSNLKEVEDGSFDLVLFCDVLDHLRDEDEVSEALVQASRIAAKGLVVTIGELTPLRTLTTHDLDWWERKIRAGFVYNQSWERFDDYGGATRFLLWRE